MADLRDQVAKWLIEKDIWQIRLEDEGGIYSFATDRGISSFNAGRRKKILWQLGLLSADLVTSENELEIEGLNFLEKDAYGQNSYADSRILSNRFEGFIDSANELPKLDADIELLFHPFRYYVLYHLDRILELKFLPLHMIINKDDCSRALQEKINDFNSYSTTPEFIENVKYWNWIVTLCVALEPCFHQLLFSTLKYSLGVDDEEQYKIQIQNISKHWDDVEPIIKKIGLEQLEKIRADLCWNAEMLDSNTDIHTLLRLTKGDKRISKVKGRLGGSLILLTMAEILRRAAEKSFKVQLQEEDELGSPMWVSDVRKEMYGSARLVDNDRTVRTHWLREFGLDAGIRLRWYVEGKTEYYALDSVIGRYGQIELIDLKGRVVERGEALSFRDSLKNDIKALRFSFISIDGDLSKNISVVKKAAQDDEICGMFFIPDKGKDFEFKNFTSSELEEILFKYCVEETPDSQLDREAFHDEIKNITNADDLLKTAQKFTGHTYISKGEKWGKRLMDYASQYPLIETSVGKRHERQIIKAINLAVHACSVNYVVSKNEYKINPNTGMPKKRKEQL